jgi:uracil-DNA glycosylase
MDKTIGMGQHQHGLIICRIKLQNPQLTESAKKFHKCPPELSPVEFAYRLSKSGSTAKHFQFHKEVLEDIPIFKQCSDIGAMAFFTEIVLCPTKNRNKIKKSTETIKACFETHLRKYINSFKVVVALGKDASLTLCNLLNISVNGRKWNEIFDKTDEISLITAKHPAARFKKGEKTQLKNRLISLISGAMSL